jgi:hypothetical protein
MVHACPEFDVCTEYSGSISRLWDKLDTDWDKLLLGKASDKGTRERVRGTAIPVIALQNLLHLLCTKGKSYPIYLFYIYNIPI